jgi:DNA-binding NtrC family response regulator
VQDKVKGFELGAVDYISKPYEAGEVIARVDTHLTIHRLRQDLIERNQALERQLNVSAELVNDASQRVEGPLIGDSASAKALQAEVASLGESSEPVSITGPRGAGMEAVARALHAGSSRSSCAFLYVDCMALQGDAGTTLFGSRSSILKLGGQRRLGKWDLAVSGTLFLDHVDALPAAVQKSLAKKLVESDGDDVKLVSYASRDLSELASVGAFSNELAEALTRRTLRVPSLAERGDDLPLLVEHFVRRSAARLGKPIERVSKRSQKQLARHRWPGDLEELKGVLECAVATSEGIELEIDEALLSDGGRIGNYRLIEKLGEGGMGEVWRATHELLRRPAAVKLISRQHITEREQRAAAIKRFEREAYSTASLCSPNTVQLYDYGISDSGDMYYVMELLSGLDLDSLVKRFGPMPPERAVWFLRQACRSLSEAHEAQLVHRDIKPANLFSCVLGPEYDFLKVLDFGVVKSSSGPEDVNLTGVQVIGSPAFMPPELVMGSEEVDGRADLYGLGCVAYWLITGQTVFQADTPTAMCVQHATAEPRPVSVMSDTPVPPALEDLLLECLQKEAAARPADALDLWRRLGEVELTEAWTRARAEDWWRLQLPEHA